jgi:DNA-binding transcriptional LysR family regulator
MKLLSLIHAMNAAKSLGNTRPTPKSTAKAIAKARAQPPTLPEGASPTLAALDLNLLRLFDAVYRTHSVSRAAELLQISQPAASNGIARLRALVGDALFARVHGGVRPTPAAEQIALPVQAALELLSRALDDPRAFEPARTQRLLRLHLSDIGEARFLPALLAALDARAPGLRLECRAWPQARVGPLLDTGELDFAIGFLPGVPDTERVALVHDRYVLLVRAGHPVVAQARRRAVTPADLRGLDFVAVHSHSETLRILEALDLQQRVRLAASHFLALPAIVRDTNLAVLMPGLIARDLAAAGHHAVIEPRLPRQAFTVSLHWSRRQRADPALLWFRDLVKELFVPAAVGG